MFILRWIAIPIVLAALGFHASSASAQCMFGGGDPPLGPATTIGWSTFRMVRAYAGCPSTGHSTTVTAGGSPSCTPVIPTETAGSGTPFTFATPNGRCIVKLKAEGLIDCSTATNSTTGIGLGLDPIRCHVTRVLSECKLIATASSVPIDGVVHDGWTLKLLLRITMNDREDGDMTVVDYPLSFPYSTPAFGAMQLESSTAEAFLAIGHREMAMLDPCTSIEIVDMTIKDPAGKDFAKSGLATFGEL
jgi:hypothetical protein